MLEKARAKNKKPKSSAGISSMPNITVGTQASAAVMSDIFTMLCDEFTAWSQKPNQTKLDVIVMNKSCINYMD